MQLFYEWLLPQGAVAIYVFYFLHVQFAIFFCFYVKLHRFYPVKFVLYFHKQKN
jgi:hypothetical protein